MKTFSESSQIDIQEFLNRAIKIIEESSVKPDYFYSCCTKCGTALWAPIVWPETCPMCDPETYKEK